MLLNAYIYAYICLYTLQQVMQNNRNICEEKSINTTCPPGHHHNGFALWQLMHLGT